MMETATGLDRHFAGRKRCVVFGVVRERLRAAKQVYQLLLDLRHALSNAFIYVDDFLDLDQYTYSAEQLNREAVNTNLQRGEIRFMS